MKHGPAVEFHKRETLHINCYLILYIFCARAQKKKRVFAAAFRTFTAASCVPLDAFVALYVQMKS